MRLRIAHIALERQGGVSVQRDPHTSAWPVALGGLIAFLPIVTGYLLRQFRWISDTWIIQESSQTYVWMAIVMVAYSGLLCFVLRPDIKGVLGLTAFGALGGWLCGPELSIVLNCAGDGSPGIRVEAHKVEYIQSYRRPGSQVRFDVRLPASGGARPPPSHVPLSSVVFRASSSSWASAGGSNPSTRRFEVHQGRFGLWWGRFP